MDKAWSTCTLYYDFDEGPDPPGPGAFVRSSGGSLYEILRARKSPTIPGRFYLNVVRLGKAAAPAGARVYPLFWYRR